MGQKVQIVNPNGASAEGFRLSLREKFNEILELRERVRLAQNTHEVSAVDRASLTRNHGGNCGDRPLN
jgi:hypothetical protein